MKIVIDLDDTFYKLIQNRDAAFDLSVTCAKLMESVNDGVLLPEHHGRLIDADDLSRISVDCDSFGCLKKIYAPTIIEASEEGAE